MGADPTSMGLMVGGGLLKTISDQQGVDSKEQALRNEMAEERIAHSQQLIKEDEKAKSVLSAQNLMAGASGVTAGSFSPTEESTFNNFAEDRNASNLQFDWKESSMQQQADNLDDSKGVLFASDLFDVAEKTYRINKLDSFKMNNKNIRSSIDPYNYDKKESY